MVWYLIYSYALHCLTCDLTNTLDSIVKQIFPLYSDRSRVTQNVALKGSREIEKKIREREREKGLVSQIHILH